MVDAAAERQAAAAGYRDTSASSLTNCQTCEGRLSGRLLYLSVTARGLRRDGDYFRLAATFGKCGGDVTLHHGDGIIQRHAHDKPKYSTEHPRPALFWSFIQSLSNTNLTPRVS
ncbi:unnamed protein product [Danaus chrysippus]|uniref:(African queen) hypothetical protein n=1 Tax=Danaus chrysippus TaxID=151541 RepID=A0A8J2VUQ3_9NEOP|nr:unnamed protein product [Danaus chrysippus]